MCIRDSLRVERRRRTTLGEVFSHIKADPTRAHDGDRRPDRCLLYTSDAADERSSVDLGGRRIIKKKKQGQYGRRRVTAHTHSSL